MNGQTRVINWSKQPIWDLEFLTTSIEAGDSIGAVSGSGLQVVLNGFSKLTNVPVCKVTL